MCGIKLASSVDIFYNYGIKLSLQISFFKYGIKPSVPIFFQNINGFKLSLLMSFSQYGIKLSLSISFQATGCIECSHGARRRQCLLTNLLSKLHKKEENRAPLGIQYL